MLEFSQTEAKLNASQIEEVEEFVGLTFPVEYKEHLLKYNGGQCKPNFFEFTENGKASNSNLDWFLAIYEGKYDNLKEYIEIYKIEDKRMPVHMLPIAHDPGGNLICISCNGDDFGYVYFWDHENEVDYSLAIDRDYSNLHFISKSLPDFIDSLKDI
ncbi:MAG TPA: SMI1/KNR4 family protein [Chryseolinea sp.]